MGFTVKHAFLALGMLVTGTINTIMTTWQDKTYSVGRDGVSREYSHPWFQTLTMFLGEFLCLLVFYAAIFRAKYYSVQEPNSREKKKPLAKKVPFWIFALPTCCDLTGSTVMNIGLLYTTASVYQMIRGATVLFTAIFSVIFLKRKLYIQHMAGLFFVVAGICVVGLSSVLYNNSGSAKNPALGNTLVFLAQLIVATQFVVEEKFIGKYEVAALQAVGLEGLWGIIILAVALPIFQFASFSGKPIEDSVDAALQIGHSWQLLVGNLGSIFSIAFFNFFGISVTKQLSATHRTTIDSCRTILIWMVSLLLGWEHFIGLQVVGFVILVSGTFLYNEVLPLPFMGFWRRVCCGCCFKPELDEERRGLLPAAEPPASPYAAGGPVQTPPATPRSPMDLRFRYYSRLQLPAVQESLPDIVTQDLTSFREGWIFAR
eukprot:comp21422_c0_seq1/m.29529 comp21422_c0_seq1/g.29529  ORF comp21422_c0_seq1/g.29529 comp21422_c0_seq1/m.29529 type:complete len:430 (-) comp21422_c0_seq1:524-1813(-)